MLSLQGKWWQKPWWFSGFRLLEHHYRTCTFAPARSLRHPADLDMGGSTNEGTQNWWFAMENPSLNAWWLGGIPISGNLHIMAQKFVKFLAALTEDLKSYLDQPHGQKSFQPPLAREGMSNDCAECVPPSILRWVCCPFPTELESLSNQHGIVATSCSHH